MMKKIESNQAITQYDKQSGARIRQVTTGSFMYHHPFFTIPAYDNEMQWLFLISDRTGTVQIYAEERSTGAIFQMTDRRKMNEWSVHPSYDGKYVYYTAESGLWRLSMHSFQEEKMFDLGKVALKQKGMVAAGMGTTALSRDSRWWSVHYTLEGRSRIAMVDTLKATVDTILERDTVSHMQFCPDDPGLLYYAGPLTDRVWVINRDGTGNRRLYKRNAEKKEWITHESWIPGTRELAFVDWPHGIRCIHADTGRERKIASFNAWHAACNYQGTRMVADTNFPDTGLWLFDPLDGDSLLKELCQPHSSCIGKHWKGEFPYDNGPIRVYAPQHTHPHPVFSPDGKHIVYTSDVTGNSQVYEVELPDHVY